MKYTYNREMIEQERALLAIHRRNSAILQRQIGAHGQGHAPMYQINALRGEVEAIARIKDNFRNATTPVNVDDQPADTFDFSPYEL